MSETETPAPIVIDVEGADQDGARVGFDYTATGMRFVINGAIAKAINAIADRADAAEALLREAVGLIGLFDDHYPAGVNPFLDDAMRQARALAAKIRERGDA